MSAWRPALRLAWRDARRHLTRTILAALLIALPIAAFAGNASISQNSVPTREAALKSIPAGAQAVITATALRSTLPFPQLPEGAPGPWMDDADTLATTPEAVLGALTPGTSLSEYWLSPPLAVTSSPGLAPGEQRDAVQGVSEITSLGLEALGMAELFEAETAAFQALAPQVSEGAAPTRPTEVMLSRALADRIHAGIGDTITFVAPPDSGVRGTDGTTAAAMQNSSRGFTVTGIAEGTDTAPGTSSRDSLHAPGKAEYRAWAPKGWLAGLIEAHPQGVQRHWIASGDAPLTWGQAKALNAQQAFAVSRHVLEHYPSASELYPVQVEARTYLERAAILAILVVIGGMLMLFLVTPALAVSAEQSRRTLGLASAAGAAARDIRRIVLAQGLLLGVLGGIVGALGALAIAAASGGAAALARFPWWTLAACVPAAVLLGLLAALGPARTAARLSPVDALRDRRPSHTRAANRWGLVLGLTLLLGGIAAAAASQLLPIPAYPSDIAEAVNFPPGTRPPGSDVLLALLVAAIIATLIGLALTVRALVPRLGGLGRTQRPAIRMALRDAADHPSRTVPAVLGVVFSLLAASYLVVNAASLTSDMRDRSVGFGWTGTFFVSPTVPVAPGFDRAVSDSVLADISTEFPAVRGGFPVEGMDWHSPQRVSAERTDGQRCEAPYEIHTASAREVGAPFRCVSSYSGAGFQGSYRIGGVFNTAGEPYVMSDDAVAATRIEGAAQAADVIRRGGALLADASLIDAHGNTKLVVTPSNTEVIVPAMLVRDLGAPMVVGPATATKLGLSELTLVGVVADTAAPLDDATLVAIRDRDTGGLAGVQLPDADGMMGKGTGTVGDNSSQMMFAASFMLFTGIAVAAAAISVLLSATQGRRDDITAFAVGADRGFIARVGIAKAAIILGLGVPLGIGSGIALAAYQVAWNRRLEASGAWLDTVVAWNLQGWIAAAVIAAGLLAAVILTRPPRQLVRRLLD